MAEDLSNIFPLSRNNTIRGNRRIAREKVMQILFAYRSSETDIEVLFDNIFNRDFNFGDNEKVLEKDKLLKPDEVYELEADIPISWLNHEIEFAQKLLHSTIKHTLETEEKMKIAASNWDLERMTVIDRILIQIAYAEFIDFNDVPPKVTINEAIDIAKKYSTDKSSNFINGVLDAILNSLINDGLVNKKGRGLREK